MLSTMLSSANTHYPAIARQREIGVKANSSADYGGGATGGQDESSGPGVSR